MRDERTGHDDAYAFEEAQERSPETGLRPSLAQRAEVAALREDGTDGYIVTFLTAPAVHGYGWAADQVQPLEGAVCAPTADAALAEAYRRAPDIAEPGEQVFLTVHAPDGTWAVFPSLVVGRSN